MKPSEKKEKIKEYRILSVDAAELYGLVLKGEDYCICGEDGKIDFDRFTASIYNSLETKRLKKTYEDEKKKRKVKGSFELKDYNKDAHERDAYGATLSVISVSFKKNYSSSVGKKELRKFFYDHGIIIKTLRRSSNQTTARDNEVSNTYVRYKRSAGSSREGNCLFILEPLKKQMMKWSSCGFDEKKVRDKVSWESYVSLTLSNSRCEIKIPKEAILFIPDAESCFQKEVIKVSKNGSDLAASPENVTIKNKIWDGQALLDESVFAQHEYLRGKGMALLRNRFFKTCAFNTKIQAWFKDHGITDLSQLHPLHYTFAKSISDIKLVVTDSSLKSIKIKQSELSDSERKDPEKLLEKEIEAKRIWLEQLEDSFGVVKTEKPTRFFDGQMVQTSYQLINTLELNEPQLGELTSDAQDYLNKIMTDPLYMRYYLQCEAKQGDDLEEDEESYDYDEETDDEEAEENDFTFSTIRKNVIFDLLSRNDDTSRTALYNDFRLQIRKAYLTKLKQGHLLVHGTNATLFGNGYEMLSALTDPSFDFSAPVAEALVGNEVRTRFFADGEDLLCARSPHITMGNLFIAKNKISNSDLFASYFNLTNEIICVNSINECLMDRLNGCDFDSDSMLVTDNRIMLEAAKKNYRSFEVPFGEFEGKPVDNPIYLIDSDISDNCIGRIVNASQHLNSVFWDRKSHGTSDVGLYYDICKLAVLSGMEIDKAKRNYDVSAFTELNRIQSQIKTPRPAFMKLVRKKEFSNKSVEDDQKFSENCNTPMQLLQTVIKTGTQRKNRQAPINLCCFLKKPDDGIAGNDYRYADKIIDYLNEQIPSLQSERRKIRTSTEDEKRIIWEKIRDIELDCIGFVKKKMKNDAVMYRLTELLDENDERIRKIKSLLLTCICSANDRFYNLVSLAGKGQKREQLIMDESGSVEIYGIKHLKQLVQE